MSRKTLSRRRFLQSTPLLVSGAFLRPRWGFAAGPNDARSDWPMWGGTAYRNMVSSMKGIPTTWDVASGKNVKWVGDLGSQSYGNPVVSNGMVFAGTNNEAVRNPDEPGDRGVLMAFRESDGRFLWQRTSEKLASGRVNDWPYQGVCSSPLVQEKRLYYVTNRSEVVCLELTGPDQEGAAGYKEAWVLDMMEEVGSFPHNMSNCSPVSFGDLLYINTSNGQDESHVNIPSPNAPDIIALNKHTGELVWEDTAAGENILHGQWSAAAVADIDGVTQMIMGMGDGWVRGYEALTGKRLWEFDTNPKESVWPRNRNNVIATPVIQDGLVYIANGQDPEHGEGVGHLYCIDPSKSGDLTETGRVWHYDKIRRSISTAAVHEGLVYYPDFSGFFHCLDARTGEVAWVHDAFAAIWGSPMVVDGKVYLGDEDGDVVVLEAGRELKVIGEMNMGSSVYSTPVPANGALFIATRNRLYALAEGE
ncbi:MAG: PQQ-binding-like beta-propeller repeat protein [Acidobacteriota bacterium]